MSASIYVVRSFAPHRTRKGRGPEVYHYHVATHDLPGVGPVDQLSESLGEACRYTRPAAGTALRRMDGAGRRWCVVSLETALRDERALDRATEERS